MLKWDNDRDRSMFLNYKWLRSRLPAKKREDHFMGGHSPCGENSSGHSRVRRKGSAWLLHLREIEKQGILTSFLGLFWRIYAFIQSMVKKLGDAPPASLEAQFFGHTDADTVYLSREQLRKYGLIEARPLGNVTDKRHGGIRLSMD